MGHGAESFGADRALYSKRSPQGTPAPHRSLHKVMARRAAAKPVAESSVAFAGAWLAAFWLWSWTCFSETRAWPHRDRRSPRTETAPRVGTRIVGASRCFSRCWSPSDAGPATWRNKKCEPGQWPRHAWRRWDADSGCRTSAHRRPPSTGVPATTSAAAPGTTRRTPASSFPASERSRPTTMCCRTKLDRLP